MLWRNSIEVAWRFSERVSRIFDKPCCGTTTPFFDAGRGTLDEWTERLQRIVYASNECNYCPKCQTGGKLLADRALSRLLKKNWPHGIEDLEGS